MIASRKLGLFLALSVSAVGCSDGSRDEDDHAKRTSSIAASCTGVASPMCAAGTVLSDDDGDGCFESCKPVSCPPVMAGCEPGEELKDIDGDGCALECAPKACPAIMCAAGTVLSDDDGDGCFESCKPVSCPPFIPTCPPGQSPTDTDGDGCPLECK